VTIASKPRIAIPVPTTHDLAYNQRAQPGYARALALAGGEPVELPLSLAAPQQASALRELLATCHGVCLPGSPADVDPARYGQPREPVTAPADPAREALDLALLEDAERLAKPVLAICFGLQMLNVWRGGSLVQDLTPLPVNHEAGSKVAIAHTALIARPSLLAEIVETGNGEMGNSETPEATADSPGLLRLPINTSHHQAVAVPGAGLRIVARCPDDGVIEALELAGEVSEPGTESGPMFHVEHPPRQFLLGVQWHPERSYDISPASRALFARLITEARAYAYR